MSRRKRNSDTNRILEETCTYTVMIEVAICVVEVDSEVIGKKRCPHSFGPDATPSHWKKSGLFDMLRYKVWWNYRWGRW